MSEQQDPKSAPVTIPETGTYTRRDGTTVELEAGTEIPYEHAVELGLVETEEEEGGGEETIEPQAEKKDDADQ